MLNTMHPGAFTDISEPPYAAHFTLSSSAQPYLQVRAANALRAAAQARGRRMQINSALRSLPQQVLLYKWSKSGRCGIRLAARPGGSNHQSGAAVDIDDHRHVGPVSFVALTIVDASQWLEQRDDAQRLPLVRRRRPRPL